MNHYTREEEEQMLPSFNSLMSTLGVSSSTPAVTTPNNNANTNWDGSSQFLQFHSSAVTTVPSSSSASPPPQQQQHGYSKTSYNQNAFHHHQPLVSQLSPRYSPSPSSPPPLNNNNTISTTYNNCFYNNNNSINGITLSNNGIANSNAHHHTDTSCDNYHQHATHTYNADNLSPVVTGQLNPTTTNTTTSPTNPISFEKKKSKSKTIKFISQQPVFNSSSHQLCSNSPPQRLSSPIISPQQQSLSTSPPQQLVHTGSSGSVVQPAEQHSLNSDITNVTFSMEKQSQPKKKRKSKNNLVTNSSSSTTTNPITVASVSHQSESNSSDYSSNNSMNLPTTSIIVSQPKIIVGSSGNNEKSDPLVNNNSGMFMEFVGTSTKKRKQYRDIINYKDEFFTDSYSAEKRLRESSTKYRSKQPLNNNNNSNKKQSEKK